MPSPEPAAPSSTIPTARRVLLGLLAMAVGAAAWLPLAHALFRPDLSDYRAAGGLSPVARALLRRQVSQWNDPASAAEAAAAMRRSNAEWDFMGRSFLCWSLAEASLREPATRAERLAALDRILDATLALERERTFHHFLMPYSKSGRFVRQPARSLFVDGEIALSLGLRRLAEEKEAYRAPHRERVKEMVDRLEAAPAMLCESYPDECWLFDHATALAAIRVHDALEGEDHGPLLRRWAARARERLVHRETGLLQGAFTVEGRPTEGPEGSSLWHAVHCLRLVDGELAADQYLRARAELGGGFLGFGYAREWPRSGGGGADIDSGAVLPLLGASPASSGLALVAAASFGDDGFLASLLGSLDLAGFPVEEDGGLRFASSNGVGDAVLLYALVLGPAWEEVARRAKR